MLHYTRILLIAASLMITVTAFASQELPQQPKHTQAENELVQALAAIKHGKYTRAPDSLTTLIDKRPDFKLAQYVYGQLMVARTGNTIDPSLHKRLQNIRVAMINGIRTRWTHRQNMNSHDGEVPAAIVKLAPGMTMRSLSI